MQPLGQGSIHDEAPTPCIGRVVAFVVEGAGDVVLVLLLPDWLGLVEDIPHKEVLSLLLVLQELQDVAGTHKHVIITFENEADVVAVDVQPLQEMDLFEGEVEEAVQEIPLQDVPIDVVLVIQQFLVVGSFLLLGGCAQQKQGLDPLTLHLLLLAPGPPDGLTAVVLRDDRLDHNEQVDVPAAFLRVVDQHGEVAAVSVEQELLEIGLQPFEPVHLAEVLVG